MPWSEKEYLYKLAMVRKLLSNHKVEAILIEQEANFAWLTGGRGFVGLGAEKSRAHLLITDERVYLLTNNIEAGRNLAEEVAGLPLELYDYPWWDEGALSSLVFRLTGAMKWITDSQLGRDMARLRWQLLPGEMEAYREAGRLAAAAIEEVCFRIKPGVSETTVAGWLAQECLDRGLTPAVLLVGADERAFEWRHPLPTEKRMGRYALLVLGARRYGLHVSCTRLVHFGPLPAELRKRHEAVCRVDAAYIAHTWEGRSLGEIFQAGVEAYRKAGFPDEWGKHHQGGLTGYMGREILAGPECQEQVRLYQAYAWNPSISGVKSEDTLIVTEAGPEIITRSERFPQKEVMFGDFACLRPDILRRD